MYVPSQWVSCPPTVGLAQCLCLVPPGLIGNIYLNDSPLKKFKIYSLDMKKSFFQRWVLPCAAWEQLDGLQESQEARGCPSLGAAPQPSPTD